MSSDDNSQDDCTLCFYALFGACTKGDSSCERAHQLRREHFAAHVAASQVQRVLLVQEQGGVLCRDHFQGHACSCVPGDELLHALTRDMLSADATQGWAQ